MTNNVTIKACLHDALEKIDIQGALDRNWSIDSQDIEVIVSGNRVVLNGSVDSIYQRDEAGRIAWNAPGVRTGDTELVIETWYSAL